MTAAAPAVGEFEEWRRVDVRTVLLIAVPAIAATAFFLAIAVAARSRTSDIAIETLAPLIGLGIAVARYVSGRFRIGDGAVHWTSGILVRQSTQVAIDRIQDVEVTRPVIARLLGCSAVRISSAGGAGQIQLSYLDREVAERLGVELRHRIDAARGVATIEGATSVESAPAAELHRVTSAELRRWALRRAWPLAVAVVVALVVMIVAGVPPLWMALLPASPIVLLIAAGSVVDRVGLVVTLDERSLFTAAGLTTLRRTTTQRARVHLVSSHRLWSQVLGGTESVRYASADVSGESDEGTVREELALDVPAGTWEQFARIVVGIEVPPDARQRRKPASVVAASRRRGLTRGGLVVTVPAVLVAIGFAINDRAGLAAVIAVGGLLAGLVAGPAVGHLVGRRRLDVERWVVTGDAIVVTSGVFRRVSSLLRVEKLQAVAVTAGPLQRRLGLVTVAIDVAPPGSAGAIVVHDVTVDEGAELLAAAVRAGAIPLPDGV